MVSGATILGDLAANTTKWENLVWTSKDAFSRFIPGSIETSMIAILLGAAINCYWNW